VPAASSLRFDNYEGSVVYYVTAGRGSRGRPGLYARHARVALGAFQSDVHGRKYLLSKRTDLYVNVLYQKVSSSVGQAWIESISAPSSTTAQVAVVAGIRHKF